MTTSDYDRLYVWGWMPNSVDPVPVGVVTKGTNAGQYEFAYGRSYLDRGDAMDIGRGELPLARGSQTSGFGLNIPGCLRDASPDSWGRRVILNQVLGARGRDAETADLDEMQYWALSGSDRIGALDFQRSPTEYVPRVAGKAELSQLLEAARLVEEGKPLPPDLDAALRHGTSIGGARPKALIESDDKKYIAKFSSSADPYPVVKAEFIAMQLAQRAGLDVANAQLVTVMRKDVLLVERFDRTAKREGHWLRHHVLSGLTLLGLDEMSARYASYEDLAECLRLQANRPAPTLRELFSRLVFNVLCGNTDDHARNHAAFWDGSHLSLTPAYDICPQVRTGGEASQAMMISGSNRLSSLAVCISACESFQIERPEAERIVESQIEAILANWASVVRASGISPVDELALSKRAFLSPFAFDGYGPKPDLPTANM